MKTKSPLETEPDTQAEQAAQATPRQRPTALDQVGGIKGIVYSALPALTFVIANNFSGELKTSITAAFAVAVAIGVARLVRKESVQPAVSGVFGVALAGGVVWFTGSAKDYFLIGIWGSLAGAILLLASVLVRWPLAGVIWNGATGKGHIWRADKRSRLYYDIATLVMAALFGARFAVKQYFYETDQIGSLGIAKIALGFPLLALGFLVFAWAARRSNKRLTAIGLLPAKSA